ncbi:hypothetical protein F2Q69_00018430 [Brassica cretica]|uniref:Uncharacterized protein n=1 Tax=Brassica cretica TaxID=69181 RepID=A0A8S9Q0W2_BRACR|nr:hypothetical protein F2Q69_00018430 [Brassica cretica]
MARIRKRVQAVRRAADGSAFDKCEECGVMIAIALFDMHECGEKRREPKMFKCVSSDSKPIGSFGDEPRSPFVFFLYSRAEEVDLAHNMKLKEEAQSIHKVDDEADSKAAAKCDKFCECCDHEEEDFDSSDHFEHEFWEDDTVLKY